MKKRINLIFILLIGIGLITGIVLFVFRGPQGNIATHDIVLLDPESRNVTPLDELLSQSQDFCVLFFDLAACDFCIGKSVEIIEQESQSMNTAVVVLDDFDENVIAWAVHCPTLPVFRIKVGDYIKSSDFTDYPVLMYFHKGELVKYIHVDVYN